MDRRETLKSLLLGGVAGTTALTLGCDTPASVPETIVTDEKLYGRTPAEKAIDQELLAMDSVFTTDELATIAVLCDIILPATSTAGSASQAKVQDFIDFIVKDIPNYQLQLKGGLMWLNRESVTRFSKPFIGITGVQQLQIVDDIAYPDEALSVMKPGVAFFNVMRNLTLTGYYTSKMGIEDLGYKGNMPNVWDGVPEEVLKSHDVAYDPEWIAKCVDQSKRADIAQWDEQGNLLT